MKTKNINQPSIKKNFIYSTFYQILSVITPFITAPYISRVLGAEAIGIQSFTTSIQSYFVMFAALGTLSYGAQTISQNRDDIYKRSKLFWEIELLSVFTSIICMLAWLCVIFFSSRYRVYYLVLTTGLIATMLNISWLFTGLEQFKIIVVRDTFFKILGIICLFICVKSSDDLLLYMIISGVSGILSDLSMWRYLPRLVQRVSLKELKIMPHFKETLIYFVPTISSSIYLVLDRTLLGLITGNNAEIGYYQQAEKVISIAKSVVFTSINSVVGVRIAYLYAENKIDEIHRRIENSLNYIFIMGFGCMFGLMGVARNFVPIFFGAGYDRVIPLLYIFCPIVVIIGVSNCLGSQYYTPSGRRAQSAKYIIVGSITNLLLNLILIPIIMSYGAAIASILAETVITALYMKNCNGFVRVSTLVQCGGKKFISGSVMFLAVVFTGTLKFTTAITLVLQVFVGVGVYGLVLIIVKDAWMLNFLKSLHKRVMGDRNGRFKN